jgi:hypothetical protein
MSSDSPAPNPSIICPRCGTRSFHPKDIEHGYCGSCHDFTHGGIDGAESLEIWVNGIVAVRDNRPYVQLSTTKGIVAQLTISQVRKVATDMMTIAYRTEMDAMGRRRIARRRLLSWMIVLATSASRSDRSHTTAH